MKLILNQAVINTKNEIQASKGETVELISDSHFPVLLVENNHHQTFSVRYSGTDYEEQKQIELVKLTSKP